MESFRDYLSWALLLIKIITVSTSKTNISVLGRTHSVLKKIAFCVRSSYVNLSLFIHGFDNGSKQLFFITHGFHLQERMWECVSAPPWEIRNEWGAGDRRQFFCLLKMRQRSSISTLLHFFLQSKQERLYWCSDRYPVATVLFSEHFLRRKKNKN